MDNLAELRASVYMCSNPDGLAELTIRLSDALEAIRPYLPTVTDLPTQKRRYKGRTGFNS